MSKLDKKFDSVKDALKDRKSVLKATTKFVVRRSVSGVLVTLVHNYVPTETKAQKAELYVAAWALGGVVGDSAADWAGDKIVSYYELISDLHQNVKDAEEANSTWANATKA